jgi:hypothetical protein
MRLLLVADLHYSLPQFDWVLAIADNFDVVVMAGDHLDLGSIVDGRAQSVVVRKYFSRLQAKTTLLICSGNHDLDTKTESGEKIASWLGGMQGGVLSDGDSFVLGDTLFTICPWWDGPIVRARRTSCFPAMCISRPSSRRAPGSIVLARPGCSMPASNSAHRRRISSSIPKQAKRCGSPRPEIRSSSSSSRSSGRCRD